MDKDLHTILNPPKGGLLGEICQAINNNWQSFSSTMGDENVEFDMTNPSVPRIFWNGATDGTDEYGYENFGFRAKAESQGLGTYYVEILGGTVQTMFGGIAVMETQELNGIHDDTYFWIEYKAGDSPSHGAHSVVLSIDNWALCWGDEIPQPPEPEEDDGEEDEEDEEEDPEQTASILTIFPLFKIENGVTNNVVQFHVGSIYVPTVSNVVQIQSANGD